MRDIWVHIHIPKCGGSTFTEILKSNHGSGFLTTNSVLNNYQYSPDQVLDILDHHPKCTCLTGHKLSIDLPYDCARYSLKASTFVRDPIDRFVSHYFFHRNHTDWVPEAKKMDLSSYIDWALRDGHQRMYINGQTRFLTGATSKESLEKLKSLINRGFLLLPLSRFDEVLLILSKLFPHSFAHIQNEPRNVSTKDQRVTDDQKERIRNFCKIDTQLCQLAEDNFDGLRTKEFPSETEYSSAMAAFSQSIVPPFTRRLRRRILYELKRLAARIDQP
jgi:hypothetical protein